MRFTLTAEKSGLALGEYDERAPCIRLEQGSPRAGMKRPLNLTPGEQTVVDYPLDGHAKGEPRTLAAIVRRASDELPEQQRPSPVPSRPRVVEVEQPARNMVIGNIDSAQAGVMVREGLAVAARTPKPPAKVDAPPVSATRRRVVRKTP
jgi:hypothetical protein